VSNSVAFCCKFIKLFDAKNYHDRTQFDRVIDKIKNDDILHHKTVSDGPFYFSIERVSVSHITTLGELTNIIDYRMLIIRRTKPPPLYRRLASLPLLRYLA